MYIRLEYSENSGSFHFSPLNEHGENTNGYITLSSKININLAEQFCEQIKQKFPEKLNQPKLLSFAQVKTEFLNYIREELNAIQEAMTAAHKYRSRIYRQQ